MFTKSQLLEAAIQMLPYSDQIKDIDFDTEVRAVRLTWRGNRFRISDTLMVEIVGDGVLCSDDLSMLAEQLIKQYIAKLESARAA